MDYSTFRLSRIFLRINKDKHFSCDLRRSNLNFMLWWGRVPSEPLAILHVGPGSILTYFHHTRWFLASLCVLSPGKMPNFTLQNTCHGALHFMCEPILYCFLHPWQVMSMPAFQDTFVNFSKSLLKPLMWDWSIPECTTIPTIRFWQNIVIIWAQLINSGWLMLFDITVRDDIDGARKKLLGGVRASKVLTVSIVQESL